MKKFIKNLFCVLVAGVLSFGLVACGGKGGDDSTPAETISTITFDYGVAKELFDNAIDSQSASSLKGVESLPTIKTSVAGFMGWYNASTNEKINLQDSITEDITAEARFDIEDNDVPAGLYSNGKMTKTWDNIVADEEITATSVTISSANKEMTGELVIDKSIKIIEDLTFADCKKLTRVTLPNGLTTINNHAFYRCENLTSITIPGGVTYTGMGAFSGCKKLSSLTIEESNVDMEIDLRVFSDCVSLTEVTIPGRVRLDHNYAEDMFTGCTKLKSATIMEGVTAITRIFRDCVNLTNVTLPNSLVQILWASFEGCVRLASITIPESVTTIGSEAFRGCSDLTSITLPASITHIYNPEGSEAFADCRNLTELITDSPYVYANVEAVFPKVTKVKVLKTAVDNTNTYLNSGFVKTEEGDYFVFTKKR